jgi:tripartite-type tricarboxylate transporter receptor subunit TctC
MKRAAGIDIRHVPYRGASLAMPDARAGHIHAICTTLTSASAQIRSGRLRALALSSGERLDDFRDVATFRELGFPQLVATVWFGLSGPAGIPSDIVNKLSAEIARILQLRDVRERLRHESVEAASGGGAKSYGAFVAAEIERWTPVVRASGAKAD